MLAGLSPFSAAGCRSESQTARQPVEELGQTQQALTDTDVSHVTGGVWYVNNAPYLMKGVDWDPSETCEWYTQYNWGRAPSDALLMQGAGINTIRTYGFTSAKAGLPAQVAPGVSAPSIQGPITLANLDSLLAAGVHVILTVHSAPGDSTWTGAAYNGSNILPHTGDFTADAKTVILKLVEHPAVIALGVGNEIDWNYFYTKDPGGAWSNGWSENDVIDHANYVANKIRALYTAGGVTGKPIAVSWGNTTNINSVATGGTQHWGPGTNGSGLNADVISYQLYDSLSLDNVFSKHNALTGMNGYPAKPFYMSEFGADAWNMNLNGPGQGGLDEASQALADTNLFKQILDNATTGTGTRVTGGTIFSWSDGWWKAGNPCTHEIGGVAPGVGPYPDLTFNEEYWGLCTSDQATRVCRKALGALGTLFAQYPSAGGGSGPSPRSIASNLCAQSNDGQSGVQFETTSDVGGCTQDAGWISSGSSISWVINVPTTGAYSVTTRSASTAAASYAINVDGTQVVANNIASTGGYQTWQSFQTNQFNMTAGTHTLQVAFTSAGQNFEYIAVNAQTGGGGGGGSNAIEAEAFNSQSGNVGTQGCSEGGLNIDNIGNGNWTEYNNVNLQGVTSFDVRVASANYPDTIEFHSGSPTGTLLASCSAPFTGGWQTWQTVSCSTSGALSGTANLYLVYKNSSCGSNCATSQLPNVQWFRPVVGGTSQGGGGTGSQPTQLRITNQCSQPIWIAHQEGAGGPLVDAQNIQLAPGTSYDYAIPAGGLQAARFMPKTGCDSTGNNCKSGQEIAPCPSGGCQPPIETKFEATFGTRTPNSTCPNAPSTNTGSCLTWYDLSFVDGYTLPAKVIPKIKQAWSDCVPLDASGLDLGQCPSGDNLEPGSSNSYNSVDLRMKDSSGNVVGCMSPCKRLNYGAPYGSGMSESTEPALHMCCPTPVTNPNSSNCTWAGGCATSAACNDTTDANTVVHTQYVNNLHHMVPGIYTFAYDDAQSLRTCMPDTQFEVIYCPGGANGGGASGSATCTDGIQNQGETGVDCGGPCAACPSCHDGIKNEGETGIDCGGPCAACNSSSPNSIGAAISVAATGGWTTTTTGSATFAAQSGTGTLCLNGAYANGNTAWVARVTQVTAGSTTLQAVNATLTGAYNDGGTGVVMNTAPSSLCWSSVNMSGVTSASVTYGNGQPANDATLQFTFNTNTACVPTTCSAQGKNCGTIPDGCSGTLNCGTCGSGQTCGSNNVCASTCTPKTCSAQKPVQCGSGIPDGCGGTLNCGNTCVAPQTCGGGGTANVCGTCVPTTCQAQGKNCGSIPDGCGNSLACGPCSGTGQTCGGGGTANVCGCTPTTCALQGKNCGSIPDGCGGTLNCGTCGSGTCGGGGTANVCGSSGTGCYSAYAQGSCATYTTGTQVSNNGHNWTCSNGNCANCSWQAGCVPGATGCPWGVVWTDNGACH